MIDKYSINKKLPRYREPEILSRYPKDQVMIGYTLDDTLSVLKVECKIESNGSWNYHNNYDDSEYVMKIKDPSPRYSNWIEQWFTTDEKEILKLQSDLIDERTQELTKEIHRLKTINIFI